MSKGLSNRQWTLNRRCTQYGGHEALRRHKASPENVHRGSGRLARHDHWRKVGGSKTGRFAGQAPIRPRTKRPCENRASRPSNFACPTHFEDRRVGPATGSVKGRQTGGPSDDTEFASIFVVGLSRTAWRSWKSAQRRSILVLAALRSVANAAHDKGGGPETVAC
jgi:hypothetical protein